MRYVTYVFVVLSLVGGNRAHADDEPWAVGITEEQKTAAKALLDEGNARFVDNDYLAALGKYREAARIWDHPTIRFNIVRCLIQLDRTLEASENLELALKYGATPLPPGMYEEALSYQKLLAKQIGELDVGCSQSGVVVTLDGKPLMHCPGREHRRLTPGDHQIVGAQQGYLTKTIDVVVFGGKQATAELSLVPITDTTRVVNRWPTWQPWTVFGGGLVVVAIGGALHLKSNADLADYDLAVARGQFDTSLRSRALTENGVAIGVATAGAVAVLAGSVMLYLNRDRTIYVEPRLAIEPRSGGALATLSFDLR